MKKFLILFSTLFLMLNTTHAEQLPALLSPEEITPCHGNSIIKHEIYVEGIGNVDIQEFDNQTPMFFSNRNIPSSFDAVANGWVTPIKNQKQYGTCWAFSTISAIETNMIKKGYETKDSAD